MLAADKTMYMKKLEKYTNMRLLLLLLDKEDLSHTNDN